MDQATNKLDATGMLTLIVYILQAVALPTIGLTSLVAVIINYVKVEDVAGTWLASHFRWQIRTFWFALLWCVIAGILFITIIGILVAWAIWAATAVWMIYRIVKGILRLLEGKAMYTQITAPLI